MGDARRFPRGSRRDNDIHVGACLGPIRSSVDRRDHRLGIAIPESRFSHPYVRDPCRVRNKPFWFF